MITSTDKANILQYVQNCIDLNPDASVIQSTFDAFEFYGIIATKSEMSDMSFEITQKLI
jgi:hypothetical protein